MIVFSVAPIDTVYNGFFLWTSSRQLICIDGNSSLILLYIQYIKTFAPPHTVQLRRLVFFWKMIEPSPSETPLKKLINKSFSNRGGSAIKLLFWTTPNFARLSDNFLLPMYKCAYFLCPSLYLWEYIFTSLFPANIADIFCNNEASQAFKFIPKAPFCSLLYPSA